MSPKKYPMWSEDCFPTKIVVLISEQQLLDSRYILGLRIAAYSLRITASFWPVFITNFWRDFQGILIDKSGNEVYPNLDALEDEYIREWFRDWICKPMAEGVRPRLRGESKERIILVGTTMKAMFEESAIEWLAANDNQKI